MSAWVLKRNAARVVLLNQQDEIFLIQAIDPADRSKPPWWEIPGGGIDPGETSVEAARRELKEEAGILTAEVGPIIWTQHVEFDFAGYHFDQDEVIHVARTAETHLRRPEGLESLEILAFQSSKWWSLDEVVSSAEPFLPSPLPDLLPDVVAGKFSEPPLDISPS